MNTLRQPAFVFKDDVDQVVSPFIIITRSSIVLRYVTVVIWSNGAEIKGSNQIQKRGLSIFCCPHYTTYSVEFNLSDNNQQYDSPQNHYKTFMCHSKIRGDIIFS